MHRIRNRFCFFVDLLLLPLATYIAYVARVEGTQRSPEIHATLIGFVLATLPIRLLVLFSLGEYCRLWRYASVAVTAARPTRAVAHHRPRPGRELALRARMEGNVDEAILNNILGTKNVVECWAPRIGSPNSACTRSAAANGPPSELRRMIVGLVPECVGVVDTGAFALPESVGAERSLIRSAPVKLRDGWVVETATGWYIFREPVHADRHRITLPPCPPSLSASRSMTASGTPSAAHAARVVPR